MGLANLLLHEDPGAAVETLNAMVELLDKEGLHDRRVRGVALHARADRLLTLGLYEDAHRDALAAVEMRRGLIGAEGEMVSSLHLVGITAQQRGDTAAAAQFEAEAAALTDEFDLSHFQLATRLTALAEAYDAAEADCLLKDAEAEGNNDVAAAVLLVSGHWGFRARR